MDGHKLNKQAGKKMGAEGEAQRSSLNVQSINGIEKALMAALPRVCYCG